MSQESHVAPNIGRGALAAHRATRDRFYLGMSAALLLILLAGFSRTLFARVLFDVPPIPLHLYIHGVIVTSWFIWLVSQTTLVAFQRVDIHRQMGIVGIVLAVAVVGAALLATIGLVPRLPDIGIDLDSASGGIWGPQPPMSFVSWIVSLNVAMISGFVLFLSAAIYCRRWPEVHKRLMLLASISLMSPPLARISFWPIFGWVDEIPFVTASTLSLLLPLALHDLLTTKRVHVVTAAGGLCFVLIVFLPLMLSDVEPVQRLIRELG